MYNLSLIGKDIKHSRSKEVYEELLGAPVNYNLIDIETIEDLPTLNDLFINNDGVSVTAPYKKYYLKSISNLNDIKNLCAINCIRKVGNHFEGTNTDYLAIKEILARLKISEPKLQVIVLGDGVMAQITEVALAEMDIAYNRVSRKIHGDLSSFNYDSFIFSTTSRPVVINCCSRSFIFKGKLSPSTLFWDYNYNFNEHIFLKEKIYSYIDGLELLKLQAKYALQFWGITD